MFEEDEEENELTAAGFTFVEPASALVVDVPQPAQQESISAPKPEVTTPVSVPAELSEAGFTFEEEPQTTTPPPPPSSTLEVSDTLGELGEVGFRDLNPETDTEVSVTADDIRSNPENMDTLRRYMVSRKGVRYEEIPDDQLYNDFVNHMRSFNTNEITTVGELRWLSQQEDKATAGAAYEVYDTLGNVFVNDGLGGAVDGVKDYMWSAVTAPSSWIGLGVGKLVTRGATGVAQRTAVNNAMQQARTAALTTFANPTSQVAVQAAQAAGNRVLAAAARARAFKEITAAGLTDAAMASAQDVAYQTVMMDAGVQDRYSILQTALSAGLGVTGAGIAAIPNLTRGASGLTNAGERIAVAEAARASRIMTTARPNIIQAAKNLAPALKDWIERAKHGSIVATDIGDSNAIMQQVTRMALDTDPDSPTSLVAPLIKAGLARNPDVPFVQQVASFSLNLPAKELDELNILFKDALNISFSDFVDIMIANVRQSGQTLHLAKEAAEALSIKMAANTLADETIVGLSAKALAGKASKEAPSPKMVEYTQSIWRRALVSHPATTIVNIQGWGQAEVAKTLASIIHGGTLGTAGLIAKLVSPVSARAGKWADNALIESKHLFQSTGYKLRTLLDPYTTREAAEEIMKQMPDKYQKKIGETMFGGVDDTAARYGIDAKGSVGVRFVENYTNKAATYSGLKMQDVWTKSLGMMSELDKQLRLLTNKSLNETIDSGGLSQIPDEVWERATNNVLKDVFSFDYTRNASKMGFLVGPVHKGVSQLLEMLSNLPVVGFLFPFGRFASNYLGFIATYSPLGFLSALSKIRQKGYFNTGEVLEDMSKAMAGTLALGVLAYRDQKKEEQGLQWYQEMDSTGAIVNVQNVAPVSGYMAMGRWVRLAWGDYLPGMKGGGTISEDLMREIGDQLALAPIMRTMESNVVTDIFNYFYSTPEERNAQESSGLMQAALQFLSDTGAGFLRPLEPINVAIGTIANTDQLTDRRQLEGPDAMARSALRYVDNFFAPVLGTWDEESQRYLMEGQRVDATKADPLRESNPMGRMFGRREELPQTNIDKLLATVNIAPWTIQERTGIPEWDALVNEVINPSLEYRSERLMSTPMWKSASGAARERMVRAMFMEVRSETVEFIERELGGEERTLQARQSFLRLPQSLRTEARRFLGITAPDRELTGYQLEALRIYIDHKRSQENLVTD